MFLSSVKLIFSNRPDQIYEHDHINQLEEKYENYNIVLNC